MVDYTITENDGFKILKSKNENYFFDKKTGMHVMYGATKEDNIEYSEISPYIADIEICGNCNGPRLDTGKRKVCDFCYKSNKPGKEYMTFETFKLVLDKFPKQNGVHVLTQIAFGLDAQANINPDFKKIVAYTKECGIIPNGTVADIDEDMAKYLAENMGAIAVSIYDGCKESGYDSVKLLTDAGLKQTNLHRMISKSTFEGTKMLIQDMIIDPRLKKVNALVFLSLKQEGRGKEFNPLSTEEFNELVNLAVESKINFGMDSCGAGKFIKSDYVQGLSPKKKKKIIEMVEPCESTKMSFYIDWRGMSYPCSFSTSQYKGINMLEVENFNKDAWFHEDTKEFRKKCIKCTSSGGDCPIFKI